jgi:hypothetical protein
LADDHLSVRVFRELSACHFCLRCRNFSGAENVLLGVPRLSGLHLREVSMTPYSIVLFIHLASALALFIGFGLEWTAAGLLRRSKSPEEARAWLRVYRVSPPISGPALLLLIVSGGYLAYLTGLMKQGWIPATFVGIAVVVLFGIVFNMPRLRAIRKSLPPGNEPLTAAAVACLNDPLLATSVRLRTMTALGIVFLMATKQPFGISMLVFACALVVGLLLSIPAWLSKQSAASSN